MTEKRINFDIDDPRAEYIAEVLGNKTCKRILGLLAEKEMSAGEIAQALEIPLNTIGYNVDKLVKSGLIEKASGFLWSIKGKKIEKYRVSNRQIVISPRKIMGGVIPAVIISFLGAIGIKIWENYNSEARVLESVTNNVAGSVADNMVTTVESSKVAASSGFASGAGQAVESCVRETCNSMANHNAWAWFLLGALLVIFVFMVFNLINERRSIKK